MAFLDTAGPMAFAHRGFARDGDENSMAAFERAVALGSRYLETDVQVTEDRVALAFHDSTLDRVTDRSGRIDAMPWSEVRSTRIAGREPIPRLDDLLAAWPDVCINLDVKSERAISPAVAAIRRTGVQHRVCIGAFAQRRIDAVRRELGPDVCTSCGPGAVAALRLTGRIRARGADCLEVPARIGGRAFVDARLLRSARAHGLPVIAWTVNDRSEMHRLLDLGIAGIMTDRADVLREVLAARGQWR